LAKALTRAIEEKIALKLPLDALRPGELRPHLSMNFRLLDEHGATLVMSRNLAELRADYGESAAPSEEKAAEIQRSDLRGQFALALKEQLKFVEKSLPRELGMQFLPFGTEAELKEQIAAVALDRTCFLGDGPADFDARVAQAKGRVGLVAQEVARQVGAILAEHAIVQKKFVAAQKAFPQVSADIATQLAALLQKRFIVATPFERLQHFPRYLKAIAMRIDKTKNDATRDARWMADWQMLARPWEREYGQMRKAGTSDPFLEEFRWLLEELRVALFAQELRTPSPVSVKRLQKMWEGRPR
jgi:ATP-dependent helicase HrpA